MNLIILSLQHLTIGVQVEYQNGTHWPFGGHYKLYNKDRSKLIVEHDVDSDGYWNYIDVNDKLYIEEEFQADFYSIVNPAYYIWGMSQMGHYEGNNVYDMHVQDEIEIVTCQDSQGNYLQGIKATIEYPSVNNEPTNFTVATDANGVATMYMRDKYCSWGSKTVPLYVEDPNDIYVPQKLNIQLPSTGTSQQYITMVEYQTTSVTVTSSSAGVSGVQVQILDENEEAIATGTTDSNGNIILKMAPSTNNSLWLSVQGSSYYPVLQSISNPPNSAYSVTLIPGTFKTVTINPKDSSGNAIYGFTMKLFNANNQTIKTKAITAVSKKLFFQEDSTQYDLQVGQHIYVVIEDTTGGYMNDSFTLTYSANATFTITLRVCYLLKITTLSSQFNSPVQGITVTIQGTSVTGQTSSTGVLNLILTGAVQSGTSFSVTFFDSNYKYSSTTLQLTFAGQDITASVPLAQQPQFQLHVSVVDKNQNAISGATVTMQKDGTTIDSAITDASGTVEFEWGQELRPTLQVNDEITVFATLNGEGRNDIGYNKNGLIIGVVLGGSALIAIAVGVPVGIIKKKIRLAKAANAPKQMVANVEEGKGDDNLVVEKDVTVVKESPQVERKVEDKKPEETVEKQGEEVQNAQVDEQKDKNKDENNMASLVLGETEQK